MRFKCLICWLGLRFHFPLLHYLFGTFYLWKECHDNDAQYFLYHHDHGCMKSLTLPFCKSKVDSLSRNWRVVRYRCIRLDEEKLKRSLISWPLTYFIITKTSERLSFWKNYHYDPYERCPETWNVICCSEILPFYKHVLQFVKAYSQMLLSGMHIMI